MADAVLGAFSGATSLDEALRALDIWADAQLGDPDWSALEAEFAVRARRDPELRAALQERNNRIRGLIADLLGASCDRHGLRLPMSVDQAAHALLTLGTPVAAASSGPWTRNFRCRCSPTSGG